MIVPVAILKVFRSYWKLKSLKIVSLVYEQMRNWMCHFWYLNDQPRIATTAWGVEAFGQLNIHIIPISLFFFERFLFKANHASFQKKTWLRTSEMDFVLLPYVGAIGWAIFSIPNDVSHKSQRKGWFWIRKCILRQKKLEDALQKSPEVVFFHFFNCSLSGFNKKRVV